MEWQTLGPALGLFAAALGGFGVWMRALVNEIGKRQDTELKRIEEKIDLIRDNQQLSTENMGKQFSLQLEHLTYRVDESNQKVDSLRALVEKGFNF